MADKKELRGLTGQIVLRVDFPYRSVLDVRSGCVQIVGRRDVLWEGPITAWRDEMNRLYIAYKRGARDGQIALREARWNGEEDGGLYSDPAAQ